MRRNCDNCGKEYERPPSLIRKCCSVACKNALQRKERTEYRRVRVAKGHPVAPPSGLIPEARAVLFEKIGPDPTECHWCGRKIVWVVGLRGNQRDAIAADHVDSDWHNDSPDNLVAACGPCNLQRARAIRDDEPFAVKNDGTRVRIKRAACVGCGREFNATYGRRCSTCRKNKIPAQL